MCKHNDHKHCNCTLVRVYIYSCQLDKTGNGFRVQLKRYQFINITTTKRKTAQNELEVKSKAELVGDLVAVTTPLHDLGAPVAVGASVRDCVIVGNTV